MDQAIYKSEDNRYCFWDEGDAEYDIDREDVVTVLDPICAIGGHICQHSRLYEEDALEHDGLQWEQDVPEGTYIVTYYRYAPEISGLTQEVDWHITKDELIRNVVEHRYAEGAYYYLVEEKGE